MLDQLNLPLSIRVWLATNFYDKQNNPKVISATTILRPTKSLVMGMRAPKEEGEEDLGRKIPSAMGTAIHTAIETSWLSKDVHKTLVTAGLNENVAKRIKINPDIVEKNDIPIYMEIRSEKEIDGYTISGKFDFVEDGKLQDFKTTSVYTWINQSNADKYIEQGSIYRWLNPKIITEDYMEIIYLFTDWSAAKASQDPKYPQGRIISQKYQLMSLQETENMVREKLSKLISNLDNPEDQIPECTDEELWRRESVYKYYKNPQNRTRSTKNFKTYHEAYERFIADGSIGDVVEVKGEVVFCKYCNAVNICEQAQRYIEEGCLTL